MATVDTMTTVSMTERAARRIGEILKSEPAGSMLRISVEGGGCSGFQYKFGFEQAKAADDLVLAQNGATVLIDPLSVQYMAGAQIDYVDDLIGASFKVNNPVATSGQPASARRSIFRSFSAGARLTIRISIVTNLNELGGASAIMWPRTSKSARAVASKLS